MKRKRFYSIILVLVFSLLTGCTNLAKQDYSDVLIPVETISTDNENVKADAIAGQGGSDSNSLTSDTGEANASGTNNSEADTNDINAGIDAPEDNGLSDGDSQEYVENTAAEDNNSTDPAENASPDNESEVSETADDNEGADVDASPEQPKADSSEVLTAAEEITPADSETGTNQVKSVKDMTDEEFARLAPTVAMSFEEIVGDSGEYDGYPKAFPYNDTYSIIVDKYYQVVMVYTKDANGDYTIPVRYMKCSSGATSSETGGGTFKMRDYRVRFALFRNTNCYAQYWSLIYGRIYFHSLLYSQKDAATYTESSYNNLGHKCSHGCIRLTVPDARWIWYNIGPGTVCTIREGSADDEETRAISERLVLPELPETRPALKMGEIPWTDNWTIEEVPQEVPFVNGSQD